MWDTSSAFRAAIKLPVHSFVVKAEVLDTDMRVVVGGTFYDTGRSDGIVVPGVAEDDPRWLDTLMGNRRSGYVQNYIADGSVDVDTTRLTRRTMNLSLLNPEAEFTPASDWGGLFYVNRLIRIHRGVRYATGLEETVPIGTFMIDSADVVAERNMSIVTLTGSDFWKKMGKAKLDKPLRYPAGTHIQFVVHDLGQRAGIIRSTIDQLDHRSSATKFLAKDLHFEREAVIGDELGKFATAWGLDIYFDPNGRLVSEESRLSRSPVWDFTTGESATLLTVKASYTDEGLYNHVLVTGTADKEHPVYANAFDTDPTSPTATSKIGRRTFMYESTMIATQEQAQDTADKLLRKHLTVTQAIELQSICIPSFEGNDVVTVKESDFTKVNLRLRLRGFNIPLSSSRQTLRLQREVNVES